MTIKTPAKGAEKRGGWVGERRRRGGEEGEKEERKGRGRGRRREQAQGIVGWVLSVEGVP